MCSILESWQNTLTYVCKHQSKTETWTLTEGFFVTMGGVAFDATKVSNRHQRLVVTPDGIQFLGQLDSLPKVSRISIEDKSKADVLAKAIVVLQAGWLVLQCIARKIESLPTSLLEIHTIVHVVCAFFMYIFWFKKPLDVKDPVILDPNTYEDMLAFMMMASPGLGLLAGQETDGNEASMLLYEPKSSALRQRIPPNELFNTASSCMDEDDLGGQSSSASSLQRQPIKSSNSLRREIPRG
jgi:hypothetical protein